MLNLGQVALRFDHVAFQPCSNIAHKAIDERVTGISFSHLLVQTSSSRTPLVLGESAFHCFSSIWGQDGLSEGDNVYLNLHGQEAHGTTLNLFQRDYRIYWKEI
jgi:hypothetical protein